MNWWSSSIVLLLALATRDYLQVEAYSKTRPSIYKDAEEYTDTHMAVKLPGDKKLYFFAGPHKSASTSVEKFFANWAQNGHDDSHPHTLP